MNLQKFKTKNNFGKYSNKCRKAYIEVRNNFVRKYGKHSQTFFSDLEDNFENHSKQGRN